MDTITETEFGEDAGDVGLHGWFGEVQLGADFGVGQSAGDRFEDVQFAR